MHLRHDMQRSVAILIVILSIACTIEAQRVAPGVPPQHYQQPQHGQQYQQHPQQVPQQQFQQQQQHLAPGVAQTHYQPPVQQQQVPVHQQQQQQYQQQQMHQQQQQMHQQQQVHQQPQNPQMQQQMHHQGHHGQPQQVLNAANLQHEREHIQEHMQVPIDTSKMSEAELQFHYFKMHDSDNNNKLDGCELIKSLIHWHVEDAKKPKAQTEDGSGHREGTIYTDESLSEVVDYVLKTMDLNKDGYVDYAEYRKSEENMPKGGKQ